MLSLDPDDFLADVAEDREDSPSLPFPATEKVAEEEELEWLSNKDAFPAVETCMLAEEPPNPIANARRQNHRVSVSVVKAGIGKTLLPPMPSRRSKKGSAKVKHKTVCTYCGFAQTPPWPEEEEPLAQHILCKACGYSYKPGPLCPEDSAKVEGIKRQCTHCGITKTPQWRHGPLGRKTLCNACGVRYKSGRLCPEYRPANSPTFSNKLHSNAHRKVMQIRKQKYGTVSKPADKCTTTLMKSNKDSFPAVEILNILEQSSGIVIAKQQSPVLVLENSTNRSATLINSCGTIEPPHQTSRKFMGQQQLFCNQANNKPNKKDSANVEIEGNSPAAMRSCGTLESPHQAPSEFLGQQQLFCNQPNNKSNKKETGKVGIEGKCQNCGAEQSPRWWEGPLGPKTLCLSCGLAKYTARRQRSVSLASNKKCNKKDTAKVEMAVKPVESVDKCTNSTTTLMKLNKDPFPAVKTLNISEKPSVIVIAEQQSPVFVLENSRNSSMTLMSSSGTVDPPHQAPSEFLGQQQQQFCDQANNKPKENDTATVEIEGNSTTLMSSSGTLEPPHQAPNNFLEQQQLFWKQANNKPNKKDTARVESEANSTTLMSSCRTPKPPHQAQSEFLGQQQQFCNQAYNETNKENTAKVESEGNSTTLMSSCRTPELTHQAWSEFLVQQQLVCNQADNETNKENTAEVEIKGKCENCGAEHSPRWLGGPLGPKTLCFACGLAKCTAKRQRCIAVEVGKLLRPLPATGEFSNSTRTFPALEEFFLSQKPSNIAIAENQKPFSVLENSTNNSTTLISSCRIKIPHRTRTKGLRRRRSTIPGQQVGIKRKCLHCGKQTQRWRMGRLGPTTLCSACGNKYEPLWGRSGVTEDIAKKCQHCGSEETTQWLSCPLGPKTLCNACYHWFKYGRRQFCNQTNNNPDKKASAEVEIRRKCQHCGAEETPLWRAGPLGCKTLCNACGIRWYKFGDLCREYCPASSPTFSRELHSNFYRKVTGMRKQDIGVEMVVEPVDKKNTIGE